MAQPLCHGPKKNANEPKRLYILCASDFSADLTEQGPRKKRGRVRFAPAASSPEIKQPRGRPQRVEAPDCVPYPPVCSAWPARRLLRLVLQQLHPLVQQPASIDRAGCCSDTQRAELSFLPPETAWCPVAPPAASEWLADIHPAVACAEPIGV